MTKSASQSVHILQGMIKFSHFLQEVGLDGELIEWSLVDQLDKLLLHAREYI